MRLPSAPRRSTYNSQVLFFELFPAFMVVVSLLIGVWLYASNRAAPDESLQDERRSRERDILVSGNESLIELLSPVSRQGIRSASGVR